MFTLLLAWINAHYKWDYELTFGGTVFLDFIFIVSVAELLSGG